jgi:dTMP kinase
LILPALARGDWVVCDRFVDASFAYQGGGRGLDWGRLEALAAWTLGNLRPDLTLIFDAPVAVAQKRLHAATQNPDRFEQEQAEFFERVRSRVFAHRCRQSDPRPYSRCHTDPRTD